MELDGKVVVVTGGSMGIGEAIAKEFVDAGASAVLSSRDIKRSEEARSRIGRGERTLAVACDVRKRADLEALLKAAIDRFGRVDVWVNNAGYGLLDAVATMDVAECRQLFDTNLFGAIEGMQVATPAMKAQGSGTIINISSIVGHIPVPYMAAYSASKHAMNAIGKAARVELKGSGVHVMTVCPGYIGTSFGDNTVQGKERKRMNTAASAGATAEDVARAVLHGCLKNKREVVVPWKYWFVLRLYQLFPGMVESQMAKRLRPADEVYAAAAAARKKQA
ncbi:MAG TPA: SDR family oxidoreductase [Terriglobales bacterium]|nr:SDR family oxidoreductase [Terriglobales bacterium]